MRSFFIFIFLVSFVTLTSKANGGPVDGSSIISTGDIHFLNIKPVQLIKERLHIDILGTYCKVNVEYTLQNRSDRGFENIKYGFPIDYSYSDFDDGFEWNNDYVTKLQFSLNGKKIPYEAQEDISKFFTERKIYEEDDYQEIETKRKWYYTQFDIKAKENVTLQISYNIKCNFTKVETSKSYFPYFGAKMLYWDFSPAQYWGNGIVDDLEIIIKAAKGAIDENSLKIEGLPFNKENDIYRHTATSSDLSYMNSLRISYTNDGQEMENFIKSYSITNIKALKNIKVSSHKNNYPADNLIDGKYSTCWVPKGDGIGEWVEITCDSSFYLGSLMLIGGYTKSEETYYNNNRLKKIRIDYVKFGYDSSTEEETGQFELNLPYLPYPENIPLYLYYNTASIYDENSSIIDFGDGGLGPLKKMKITILDIYKGKKHNDTCISEILLLGNIWDNDYY